MDYIYKPYPKWVKDEAGKDIIVETEEAHKELTKLIACSTESIVKLSKKRTVKKARKPKKV